MILNHTTTQCDRKVAVHLQKVLGGLIQQEKTRSSIERPIVSEKWIKQSHTLPVLHFNRCLTTEYSETAARCNGNFDTDNQIYLP
jgi:hypothetical protein